jgi:penicillin G amidase
MFAMRVLLSLGSALLTIFLIICLNTRMILPAPLGKLLSPQEGIWQNAESVNKVSSGELNIEGLKGKVSVYFDERLVPHVFAENEYDAFFVQGYIHARFRLWQMDFQTRAAAGRLSEILGPGPNNAIVDFDRDMRRLGMVYAAEKATIEIQKDSATKNAVSAYSNGVNCYIDGLSVSELPLEYKLLGYRPEKWSFLRSALFLKYMSFDLAGSEDDFELTNAHSLFSHADFEKIYPIFQDSLDPIIPRGTIYDSAATAMTIPSLADSLYFSIEDSMPISVNKPDKDNGSNNWAVSGIKTKSGRPILCNDPHLGLNLPSLWYEMQISTPQFNAYGATFPGAPTVIIGFNDDCAWGFTNAERDVRDYYEISFRDNSRKEYFFNNAWLTTTWRIEEIKIKGNPNLYDSVAYTNIGPVIYDQSFAGKRKNSSNKNYAVRWKAHDPSNELKTFYGLNHAKNYSDYYAAIQNLKTPGQNCLFASKRGDIAIWCQGEFPAKWKRQGDFLMPGADSSFLWQGVIPSGENPHQFNPARGFVSSANQLPTDTAYPYYLGGSYPLYRGFLINRRLNSMNNITTDDMKKLQTENYNVFAELARPVLLRNIDESKLDKIQKKYLGMVRRWNLRNDPLEKGATIFKNWWDSLEVQVWSDEFSQSKLALKWPDASTLCEGLLRDSVYQFVDNIHTPQKETLSMLVTKAFLTASAYCGKLESDNKLEWAKFKGTGIRHLLRQEAFSRLHLLAGGGDQIINATKDFHGPSWRMIVHLTDQMEAYGIYPGGQSGNPGSRFYDNAVDNWVAGKYFPLWMMNKNETNDKRIKSILTFSPK